MEFTASQLKEFDGSDPSKPIYLSIKSTIYDVSTAANFYGPDGPYAHFAGRDLISALANMSKDEAEVNGGIDYLIDKVKGLLDDWVKRFEAEYPVVGRLV